MKDDSKQKGKNTNFVFVRSQPPRHINSDAINNDNGYSSTFAKNTFSSENTDTELPTSYLTTSHQVESTSDIPHVVAYTGPTNNFIVNGNNSNSSRSNFTTSSSML